MTYVPPEINIDEPGHPLIVGRDPGGDEVTEGRPFVGRSGQLLFGGWDPIAEEPTPGSLELSAGLTRSDVNIANRVPWRPWNNQFYRHSWEHINKGKQELFELIDQLQPSIIVATGGEAAYDLVRGWRTLTDRQPGDNSGGKSIKSAKGILDRRGFFYPTALDVPADCPVLATLHPASCLYQAMPNRVLLDIDLARLGRRLDGDLPRQPFPEPTRVHTPGDLEPLWDHDIVAYDIEIKWGGDAFLCIAFATPDGQTFLAYEDALGACEEWLRSDRRKLAHNSQFDRYYLEHKMGIPVGGRHEDTIVAHWACYPELAGKEDTGRETQKKSSKNEMTRKGLNFLASFHLNVPWWKTYTSDPAKMGQLCSNDVFATIECWKIMEPEIDDMGVRHQYERTLDKLPALIAVQARGMPVDEDMRQDRIETLRHRQSTLEARATEAAEEFLKTHEITHKEDGDEYWWYHDARCECCFGGDKQRRHCPSCAGVEGSGSSGSILKSDLAAYAQAEHGLSEEECKEANKTDLRELMPPCQECGGRGKTPEWNFNPMSPVQLPEILWEHLDVPQYCYTGSPDATEETIKQVAEWSEGGNEEINE